MGNSIISYDSPWEEICEAARSAPWSAEPMHLNSPLRREQLTEADINRLSGMPVMLIEEDSLPPHPRNYRQINPVGTEYAEMLAQRVANLGQRITDAGHIFQNYADPDEVIDMADKTTAYSFISYNYIKQPNGIVLPVRLDDGQSNFAAPLAHRLTGDTVPANAIMFTNCEFDTAPGMIACAQRKLWLPEGHYKAMCDLHELTHLLQLTYDNDPKPLQHNTRAERDAENNSLIQYQCEFGGSAHYAAAAIISHMSHQFEANAQYTFFPGQNLNQLDHGGGNVHALRLAAIFTLHGREPPRFTALQAWGQLQHNNLPPHIARMFGDELDEIGLLAKSYAMSRGLKGMLEDTLLGLKQMATREFDMLPEAVRPLARQITDAAAFTNPELMGFDPVKPRLRYQYAGHLPGKRNAATPA